jgi:hypothetical protein
VEEEMSYASELDISKATAGISNASWYRAACQQLEDIGGSLLPAPDVADPIVELANTLRASKVHVLEGVAGIGKTYILRELGDGLARQLYDSANEYVETYLREWPKVDDLIDRLSVFREPESVVRTLPFRTEVTVIQLHPGSSYEEVVGGVRRIDGDFYWMPGALTKAIEAAQGDLKGGNRRFHLVMLDEMNRCNLPSVLGEVMLLLEGSRRVSCSLPKHDYPEPGEVRDQWKAAGKAVQLPTARNQRYDSKKQSTGKKKPDSTGQDGNTSPAASGTETTGRSADERRQEYWLWVPSNVLILGTMNSSDRSILSFDQALRRRFPPTRLEPHTVDGWLTQLDTWKGEGVKPGLLGLAVGEILAWAAVNVMLRTRIGPDSMIGHSYLYEALEHRGSDVKTLKGAVSRMWEHGVLPQMIHAAETARQLDFVCRLFGGGEQVGGLFEAEESLGVSQDIKEAVEANGFVGLKEFQKFCEEFGVFGTSVSLRHVLKTVGQGHGRRLLVVPRQPHVGNDQRDPEKRTGDRKAILKAVISAGGETRQYIEGLVEVLEEIPTEDAAVVDGDNAAVNSTTR